MHPFYHFDSENNCYYALKIISFLVYLNRNLNDLLDINIDVLINDILMKYISFLGSKIGKLAMF